MSRVPQLRLAASVLAVAALIAGSPASVASADAPPEHGGVGFDLDAATIPDLRERMDRGSLTSLRLTAAYLRRIDALDGTLRSVVAVNRRTLAEAAASDARRRAGRALGPLDGIPVLLKDNIDTVAMPTTAGSRALEDSRPRRDAFQVTRLRSAGAVVLGKANLSEWANFRSTKPTSGWSAVGGQTSNPHVLDRNPCGSSSGSAAAVAASLAQVAIGSETDGSIVCPAGMNGVAGHKPTLGLVSRTGVVPISSEQDTTGPIARHVVDLAITLSALQARDPDDAATKEVPRGQPTDYARHLDPNALRGARIGMWRLPGLGPEVDRVMASTVDALRANGATVVDVTLPYQDQLVADEFPALLTEFRRDINAYLATRQGGPRTLADLIAHNRADPAERTCFAGQELFEMAEAAPRPDDPEYRARRARLTDLSRRSIDETLAEHRLDAIMAPTNPPAWRTDCASGDNDIVPSSTPAAVAGYPHTAVPAGFVGPLPVGLSIFAGRWADAKVLSLAAAFERAAPVRRAPRYLPTLPTG
ncbi:amidase [Streptoalloteichus hindustanus]|uniref:Amidase n=1 Tax=Streptoalloteichus hindustanus TaxID=2017 RepID=A0A1M5I6X9_STRHI|nr:amidase [Streptoalloteichus hindustanus]SHG24045.1 amidase [Streptoalloteichus hindustanus]